MRLLLPIIMLFSCAAIQAQSVMVSKPEKLSNKSNRFELIGYNNDGYIVRKYGDASIINVYDYSLNLKTSKPLNLLSKQASFVEMLLKDNGATVFYIDIEKKKSTVYARLLDDHYDPIKDPIPVDTIYAHRDDVRDNFCYNQSADKNILLLCYPKVENESVISLDVTCLTKDLQLLSRLQLQPTATKGKLKLMDVVVDNHGLVNVLLLEEFEEAAPQLHLYHYNYQTDSLSHTSLGLPYRNFKKTSIVMDELNEQTVITGFYSKDEKEFRQAAHGMYYFTIPYQADTAAVSFQYPFSIELMDMLTEDKYKGDEPKLYTFSIKDIILRMDGGAIIITESFYKQNDDDWPAFSGVPLSNSSYINIYHYNDIVVYSIAPNGKQEWVSVLPKRQASENDNGGYSSFCLYNQMDELYFLYMDEISPKSSLFEYVLKPNGEHERNPIYDQPGQDVMLLPKMGMQVAYNQILMPSYHKGDFRLVKFTY